MENNIISRLLLALVLLSQTLLAYDDRAVMTKIHAKIAPRILLMSRFQEPSRSAPLIITIMYDEMKSAAAYNLQEQILANYPKGLSKRSLQVFLQDSKTFTPPPKGSMLFFCTIDAERILGILEHFDLQDVVTMAFDETALQGGVMASLHVGRHVKPILNVAAAKAAGITFAASLVAISKIYDAEEAE